MRLTDLKGYLPFLLLIGLLVGGALLFRDPGPVSPVGLESGATGSASTASVRAGQSPNGTGAVLLESVGLILKMLLILGGICGLAWLSLHWILPRVYGPRGAAGGRMQILETLRLEPRRALVLVRVGEEAFLLASSEQGLRLLARLPRGSVENSQSPAAPGSGGGGLAPSFQDVLKRGS